MHGFANRIETAAERRAEARTAKEQRKNAGVQTAKRKRGKYGRADGKAATPVLEQNECGDE
ncbi:hypothetical protein [Natrialba asiatica]|uniref:hypothetical protein n=1 Tax=Natrialba asiatica TaxID=64602 RepID=UPI0006777B32|nr:hypothetical protein [Natrialba asiatica]